MPKPGQPIKLEIVGLDRALQPSEWPERTQKVVGECLARMLTRRKARNEAAAELEAKQLGTLRSPG